MTAVASGSELYIPLSLFKNTYHGKITMDTADGVRNNTAAFIAY